MRDRQLHSWARGCHRSPLFQLLHHRRDQQLVRGYLGTSSRTPQAAYAVKGKAKLAVRALLKQSPGEADGWINVIFEGTGEASDASHVWLVPQREGLCLAFQLDIYPNASALEALLMRARSGGFTAYEASAPGELLLAPGMTEEEVAANARRLASQFSPYSIAFSKMLGTEEEAEAWIGENTEMLWEISRDGPDGDTHH